MKSEALAPFRHPVFRAIWIATMVSNFGSVIQSVGAAWMMTSITDSETMVALVQASATLPIMLLALFAGAIADSFDRRLVMLCAQFLMLFASAVLAALTFTHHVAPWGLLVLTLLVGTGTALNGPSWQASLRMQVPVEDLPAAVALNSIGFNLARSIGPAIGGAAMALVGPAANFTLNACSYIGLIVVLLRWKPNHTIVRREPLLQAIRRGFSVATSDRAIRHALIRAGIFGILTGSLWSLMPLVARDLLRGDSTTFGLCLGAFGCGAIAGALVVTKARSRLTSDQLFSLASLGFAAGTAGVSLASHLAAALPFLVLAGVSWVSALSTVSVSVQMRAPDDAVGRCLAIYQMCAFGGLAVGSTIWGSVAEHVGLVSALSVSAALLALTPLISLRIAIPPLDPQPDTRTTTEKSS